MRCTECGRDISYANVLYHNPDCPMFKNIAQKPLRATAEQFYGYICSHADIGEEQFVALMTKHYGGSMQMLYHKLLNAGYVMVKK